MNTKLIIEISVFIIVLIISYLLYKLVLSISRTKRIEEFALDNKEDFSIEASIYKGINAISKVLYSMIIFNSIASTYDKYINKNSRFQEGMDIFSVKILSGIILCLFYTISIILNDMSYNSLIFLLIFIVGLFLPDIYLKIKYDHHKEIIDDEILRAIIIMNNAYKSNKNTETALNEVINRMEGPIELEFRKVVYDIKLGLTISESFMRMYKRTNIKIIKKIAIYLALTNKSGANIITIFDELEQELINDQKLKTELINIRKENILYYIIFMIIPIIVILLILTINNNYLALFTTKYSPILIIIEITLYTLYLYIIAKMIRRKY